MRTRENPVTKILDTCLPSVNDFCVEGVIHQCLRMSNASNLTDLVDDSAMPSRHEVAAKADLLAKRLLCCTGDALCMRHKPNLLWHVVTACFVLCSSWLYPPDKKWRKSCRSVEKLWAACAASRSLLWLSGQRRSCWAQKVGTLLEPQHRWVLWRDTRPRGWSQQELRKAADNLVYLQLLAVDVPDNASDLHSSGAEPLHGCMLGLPRPATMWELHRRSESPSMLVLGLRVGGWST